MLSKVGGPNVGWGQGYPGELTFRKGVRPSNLGFEGGLKRVFKWVIKSGNMLENVGYFLKYITAQSYTCNVSVFTPLISVEGDIYKK